MFEYIQIAYIRMNECSNISEIIEIGRMNIRIYFKMSAHTKLGLQTKLQKPWTTNSSIKVTKRERRKEREKHHW